MFAVAEMENIFFFMCFVSAFLFGVKVRILICFCSFFRELSMDVTYI